MAIFNNFIDLEKTYNIKITGLIGFEDYSKEHVLFDAASVSFSAIDFDPLATITVTGQILDEEGAPHTDGGGVIYSEYDNGSASLAGDGSFSITVYKDKDYDFSFLSADSKYNPVFMGTINSPVDISNLEASLTEADLVAPLVITNDIIYTYNTGGTLEDWFSGPISSGSKVAVNEGENSSFTAVASTGYHVKSVSIDRVFQADGTFDNAQNTYSHMFISVFEEHAVVVEFSLNTYDISVSSNGGGSILVNGSPVMSLQTVEYSETLVFKITLNSGYDISEITLDGIEDDDYELSTDGVNRPDFTGGSKFEKLESLWNNKEGKDIPRKSVTRQSGWLMNTSMTTRRNGPVSIQLLKSSA